MWKKILIGVVVVLLALVLIGFLLPAEYRVERSRTVSAKPDVVFATISDFTTWQEWTAWSAERDPTCKRTYDGSAGAAGHTMTWACEEMGQGKLTIVEADPGKAITTELSIDDGAWTSKGQIAIAADGEGTKVTWSNYGDMGANPIGRWMMVFFEGMMADEFDTGLAGLEKRLTSGGAPAPNSAP